MAASFSAEVIAGDSDILALILIRLPIESLVRFKSVSKSWLILLSKRHFCNKRTMFHLSPPSGVFLRSNPYVREFHYVDLRFLRDDFVPYGTPFELLHLSHPLPLVIHQSCNGLLLCRNEGPQDERTTFFVFNPTTNQHQQIPSRGRIDEHDGFIFVFYPLQSTEYKVVWLRSKECQIWIYCSSNDLWIKNTVDNFKHPMGFVHGLYWEEGVYWLDCESFSYLDLSNLKYLSLQFPYNPYDQPQTIEYFGVSLGHLHCVTVDREQNILYIYEMMGRENLVETHRVDISGIYPRFARWGWDSPPRYPKFTVIAVLCRAEGFDPYVVFHAYGKAMRFEVSSGSMEDLKFYKNDSHPLITADFQRYTTTEVTV